MAIIWWPHCEVTVTDQQMTIQWSHIMILLRLKLRDSTDKLPWSFLCDKQQTISFGWYLRTRHIEKIRVTLVQSPNDAHVIVTRSLHCNVTWCLVRKQLSRWRHWHRDKWWSFESNNELDKRNHILVHRRICNASDYFWLHIEVT